jgi:ABC-type sugar transport system permease subunit
MGYASAIAWILFAMIFGITLLNWKFGSRILND